MASLSRSMRISAPLRIHFTCANWKWSRTLFDVGEPTRTWRRTPKNPTWLGWGLCNRSEIMCDSWWIHTWLDCQGKKTRRQMARSSGTSSTPASLLTQQIAWPWDSWRNRLFYIASSIDSMKEILLVFLLALQIARWFCDAWLFVVPIELCRQKRKGNELRRDRTRTLDLERANLEPFKLLRPFEARAKVTVTTQHAKKQIVRKT